MRLFRFVVTPCVLLTAIGARRAQAVHQTLPLRALKDIGMTYLDGVLAIYETPSGAEEAVKSCCALESTGEVYRFLPWIPVPISK